MLPMAEIAGTSSRTPVRHLAKAIILSRLRRRGIRLTDIACSAMTTAGYVSLVISRQTRAQTPLVARIWQEIERQLSPDGAA